MYGSYNSTDFGGFSQEIEGRHQDYANRVATTQERNIGRKTQDLIDAQSLFAEGKAVKTQGAELLAGTAPAVAGVYKGLKSVGPGIQYAREYVSGVKQKVSGLAKNVSERRLAGVTGDEGGIEMEGTATEGTEMPSQSYSTSIRTPAAPKTNPTRNLNDADKEANIFTGTGRDGGNASDYANSRVRAKITSAYEDDGAGEKTADSSNTGRTSTMDAAEDDIGETPSELSTVPAAAEETEGAVGESGFLDAIGVGADFLAGPLGVILGGVALYEGIKEFADGTADEASGTSERLSAEKENIRPNIPNPNYSGKFVAPVPQVV